MGDRHLIGDAFNGFHFVNLTTGSNKPSLYKVYCVSFTVFPGLYLQLLIDFFSIS